MALDGTVATPDKEVALARMGFDLCRLGYYRWLVVHGKNPDYVGVRPMPVPAGGEASRARPSPGLEVYR